MSTATAVERSSASPKDLALTVGGMSALLAGCKLGGLAMFAKGVQGIERHWRSKHPGFSGGFKARWNEAVKFYEATHRHPVNRKLHIAGIPLILAGAGGLLVSPPLSPPWAASASSFAFGWALNIIGHSVFEKNRPAFADDPLSFIAGPVWDAQQLLGRGAL